MASLWILLMLPFLVAGEKAVSDEECESCMEQMLSLQTEPFSAHLQDTGEQWRQFCKMVEQNSTCWDDVPRACLERDANFYMQKGVYIASMKLICEPNKDNRKLLQDVMQCGREKLETEKNSCNSPDSSEDISHHLDDVCSSTIVDAKCEVKFLRDHCGSDGVRYGDGFARHMSHVFRRFCDTTPLSDAAVASPSLWISVAVASLSQLLVARRLLAEL